jgi:osmotically-inducible protein OsmY
MKAGLRCFSARSRADRAVELVRAVPGVTSVFSALKVESA